MRTTRARNKIRAWFTRERREDSEHRGREQLQDALRKQGLPAQKIAGSPLLADVIREMGFRKADDFYVALGQAQDLDAKVVVNKVMQRLKQGEAVAEEQPGEEPRARQGGARPADGTASRYGIKVDGIDDVMVRLAKCCRPVPGDEIVGYISLGRGITIHREDCNNVAALMKDPERFTRGRVGGRQRRPPSGSSCRSTPRTAPACSRTSRARFAEAGINILEARCTVPAPDGQEPLRRRGGGHGHAQELRRAPAQHRVGVRRLPGHAGRVARSSR